MIILDPTILTRSNQIILDQVRIILIELDLLIRLRSIKLY